MIPASSSSILLTLLSTGGTPAATETSSTAREREDLELAEFMDMLQGYELLEDLELLELLPVLEENDE